YEELKNAGLLITTDWGSFFSTHVIKTPITPERFEMLRRNYVRKYNSPIHSIKRLWFFRSKVIRMLKVFSGEKIIPT
ncbi:MAG: hypothetical protein OEY99_04185, partial [Aigarchaeota archaeon]|nr:hypothetical protein [Aigarchaeota archaeon]